MLVTFPLLRSLCQGKCKCMKLVGKLTRLYKNITLFLLKGNFFLSNYFFFFIGYYWILIIFGVKQLNFQTSICSVRFNRSSTLMRILFNQNYVVIGHGFRIPPVARYSRETVSISWGAKKLWKWVYGTCIVCFRCLMWQTSRRDKQSRNAMFAIGPALFWSTWVS